MPQTRASGKFLITGDIQFMVWGPRPETPWWGIGLAMVGAVTQEGTKFKSFCLKSASMGQHCKPSPGAVRDLSQCHQLHCAKGGSELRQTKPHNGRGIAQGLSSTVIYMQTCYFCEGFTTSAGSFYVSTSRTLQMWSKLLGNCRRVGGVWGIN